MTPTFLPGMPEATLATARRLYDAFAAHDGNALLTVLTPEFRGVVAEGMPGGLGGVYDGAETMLRQCWAPVFRLLDLRPGPAEYLPVAADRMIVLGRYEGTARATGRTLSAAFAHVLRFTDGRVSEIVQITDTGRWRDALA
jgi:2-(1,2-epoxy-1,2-dihydrophenyl)acetyl-CoA isomerase